MSVGAPQLSTPNYSAQAGDLTNLRLADNAPKWEQQIHLDKILVTFGFGKELSILAATKIVAYESVVLFKSDPIADEQYKINFQKVSKLLHNTILSGAPPTDADYRHRFLSCDASDKMAIFKLVSDIKRVDRTKLDLFHDGIEAVEISEWVSLFYNLKIYT